MEGMEMPLPDNTLPMMTGEGPFGGVEMGGMFTIVKVRKDQPHGNYKDPGWYRHPKGTVASEWKGGSKQDMPAAKNAPDARTSINPGDTVMKARKGSSSHNH